LGGQPCCQFVPGPDWWCTIMRPTLPKAALHVIMHPVTHLPTPWTGSNHTGYTCHGVHSSGFQLRLVSLSLMLIIDMQKTVSQMCQLRRQTDAEQCLRII
jgi:hypothetical protein